MRHHFLFAPVLLLAILSSGNGIAVECDSPTCDAYQCDGSCLENCDGCGQANVSPKKRRCVPLRDRLPAMIGDFFGGTPTGIRGASTLDRLFVFADDLDAPANLPPGTSVLSITESGPRNVSMTLRQLSFAFRL